MRDLPGLAAAARSRLGVVDTAELARLGFSPSAIRANVDAGRWQRLHHGVYGIYTGPPSWPMRAWAALTYAGSRAVLSHEAAAHVRGWQTEPPEVIDVTVPYHRRALAQPGIRMHRSRSWLHIVDAHGVPPRTTAARTVVDLLRDVTSEETAVALVLEAMRRRHVSTETLTRELQHDLMHPWRTVALRAAGHAGEGLQSVIEVRYAELERAHGLPCGRRQFKVSRLSRAEFQDVYYDEYAVVVELDGRLAHGAGAARLRDMRRDNRNALAGATTLRFGYHDVTFEGCDVARQVAQALRNAGWNGRWRRCLACEEK